MKCPNCDCFAVFVSTVLRKTIGIQAPMCPHNDVLSMEQNHLQSVEMRTVRWEYNLKIFTRLLGKTKLVLQFIMTFPVMQLIR